LLANRTYGTSTDHQSARRQCSSMAQPSNERVADGAGDDEQRKVDKGKRPSRQQLRSRTDKDTAHQGS